MSNVVLGLNFISLFVIAFFSLHYFMMIYYYIKTKKISESSNNETPPEITDWPAVTIQLPLYNEFYVAERIIDAACSMDYPPDKLEIQVLDDSTDETSEITGRIVAKKQALGFDIKHIRRENRVGYKAGALKEGLTVAKGEFIAIFDADFIPSSTFLKMTVPYMQDPQIGMVQTRWGHINKNYSLLTQLQAMTLDAHFVIEQTIRNKAGFFINFNGTSGIWRKACIIDSGDWQANTLTEDLDLSYRAQLRGWKFRFLKGVASPAELPAEIYGLKNQQFRWAKGALETARKLLPEVWKSQRMTFKMKYQSTVHLAGNIVYPFIFISGILSIPLCFLKIGGVHNIYFNIISVFTVAFLGWFLYYILSFKDVYKNWYVRILMFPLLMAGSMGMTVNNSWAVIEGLLKRKSAFVRTPKYMINMKRDLWVNKKYVAAKINWIVVIEILFSFYCLTGAILSFYLRQYSAVPFQLIYAIGLSLVAFLSIRQVLVVRKDKG